MKRIALPENETAVFSWEIDLPADLAFLTDIGVKAVFQEVPAGSIPAVPDALSGFSVYLLYGDPDPDPDALQEALMRAGRSFRGLVLDVEPYVRSDWNIPANRAAILDRYCEQMETLYETARKAETELIQCIPFWYDELGFGAQLERIVRSSDGICVMNYYRGLERSHIAEPYRLAEAHHKKLWTAYELNPAGGSGILEANTYYGQGLAAVLENYRSNFSGMRIGLALHDLNAVRKAAERETDL